MFFEIGQDRAVLAVEPGEIGGAMRNVLEIADAQHLAGVLRPRDPAAGHIPIVHSIARRGDREAKTFQFLFGTVHQADPSRLPCGRSHSMRPVDKGAHMRRVGGRRPKATP